MAKTSSKINDFLRNINIKDQKDIVNKLST